MKQIFIAEVKTQSPFGWKSDRTWDELFKIANTYGDWLSIHTDRHWSGDFDLIQKARRCFASGRCVYCGDKSARIYQ